jgi:hypothetical protein
MRSAGASAPLSARCAASSAYSFFSLCRTDRLAIHVLRNSERMIVHEHTREFADFVVRQPAV